MISDPEVEPLGELACSDDSPGRHQVPRPGYRASQLVLLGLGVAMLHWLFAADRRVFHMFPDEAGQLAMARWFGGGTRWNLFEHSTWQPGYALLLAPVYALTDDPVLAFRAGLLLNAVLSGVAAVLLALIARRITSLTPWASLGVAAIVSLLPASLSASAHTWAEPLVSVFFLATLLSLLRYARLRQSIDGLTAVVLAVAGYATHGRFLPTTAMVGLGVIFAEYRRRGRKGALASATVLVGAMTASVVVAMAARRALWEEPGEVNSVLGTLRRLDDPVALVDTLVGQLWYLIVSTAGVAVLGSLVLMRAAFGADSGSDVGSVARPRRQLEGRIVLALLIPQFALSVLFTSGRGRVDQVVYGRYNDAVFGTLLLVGGAWLVGLLRPDSQHRALMGFGVVAVSTVTTSAYLIFRFGNAVDGEPAVLPMVAGLVPYYGRGEVGGIVVPAGVGLLVLVGVLLTSRLPQPAGRWLAVVATSLVVVAGVNTHHGLAVHLNSFEATRQVEDVRALIPPGETVGFRVVPPSEVSYVLTIHQHFSAQLFQMYLPEYEFVTDEGPYDDVGPYVFAPRLDPALLDAGAVALWEEDGWGMTLWRERR